jgi:hypothetical protein
LNKCVVVFCGVCDDVRKKKKRLEVREVVGRRLNIKFISKKKREWLLSSRRKEEGEGLSEWTDQMEQERV